jgi:nucleotide-binding universal stress UspA family protein
MASTSRSNPTDELSGPADDRIVVGVDGSTGSEEALRWAAAEAGFRGIKVRAVLAWGYPVVVGMEQSAVLLDQTELEQKAAKQLRQAVEKAVSAETADSIEMIVSMGSAANNLIEQSKTATMVVVGARGHGGFMGLHLGSVSTQVMHHSHCPVVVIRQESWETR